MKSKILFSIFGLLTICPLLAFSDCAPGMVGSEKIAVVYLQGPNWEKFGEFRGKHVEFLLEQMKAGTAQYAGPFVRGEEVQGGMLILNLTDYNQADALIQNDEIIKQKVVTYELKKWLQCGLDKTQ
jgi:uncharacterized protein YciI